jgi:hypothetical protein
MAASDGGWGRVLEFSREGSESLAAVGPVCQVRDCGLRRARSAVSVHCLVSEGPGFESSLAHEIKVLFQSCGLAQRGGWF